MKRGILEIILAFIVGAFTCCVFFSVIGLVTVYIEMPLLKLTKWYRLWPKDIHYRIYFGLFESIAVQVFSQIPVTAFSAAALGLTITKRPGLHGFVAALGAISFYIYGHFSFIYSIHKTIGSIWDMLSSFTIFHIPLIIFWVLFFTLLTCSGYQLKRNGGEQKAIPHENNGKNFAKTTGLFVVPIIIWAAYYGFLLIWTEAFTELWIESLLSAVAPYLFLWVISIRLPNKTKWCKMASVIIFPVTVLAGVIRYFQFRNADKATKIFLVPSFQVAVIWFLGVITFIGMEVMLRKYRTIRKEG